MRYYIGNMAFDADYLEHHGIAGMKWGQRNGPPYPLDQKDKSAAEKRAEKGNRKSSKGETIKAVVSPTTGNVIVVRKRSRKEIREDNKRLAKQIKYNESIENGKRHTIGGQIIGGALKNVLISAAAKSAATTLGMATLNPMLVADIYTVAVPMMALNTISTGKNIVDRMLYLKSFKD